MCGTAGKGILRQVAVNTGLNVSIPDICGASLCFRVGRDEKDHLEAARRSSSFGNSLPVQPLPGHSLAISDAIGLFFFFFPCAQRRKQRGRLSLGVILQKNPRLAKNSLQEVAQRRATPLQRARFPGSITSTLSGIYEFTCNSTSLFSLILPF